MPPAVSCVLHVLAPSSDPPFPLLPVDMFAIFGSACLHLRLGLAVATCRTVSIRDSVPRSMNFSCINHMCSGSDGTVLALTRRLRLPPCLADSLVGRLILSDEILSFCHRRRLCFVGLRMPARCRMVWRLVFPLWNWASARRLACLGLGGLASCPGATLIPSRWAT